jgi:predicted DNA binding protein
MTVIAEYAFPPGSFPLGERVRAPPGTRVELERVVPTDQGSLPYVRVEGDDPDGFVEELRAQPAVASVDVLDRHDSAVLLRVRWAGVESVVRWFDRSDATLLELVGDAEEWVLRLRGRQEDVESFDAYCRDLGAAFELRRLYSPSDGTAVLGPRITETQRETLRLAYEGGYYEEPRETTLGELAAELGVGERAVSRRLRRGVRSLLAATFGDRPRSRDDV